PSLDRMYDRLQTFYLSNRKDGADYLLESSPPAQTAELLQTVDFKDRSTQNNYYTPTFVLDELDSSNGLVFATAPFDHAISIDGSFAGRLAVATNKHDLDVSMAFYEQMPDGKYLYLARYLGRASYAQDRSRRHLLVPGAKSFVTLNETGMTSRR